MKFIIHLTLYALFSSLFLFDGFLCDGLKGYGLHLFPNKLSYLVELLSCSIVLYITIIYALRKKFSIRIAYVFFFFFFVMHLLVGIVFNTVSAGAIFGGIRRYFVPLPLFFLPIVYEFSDKEIKGQLQFLMILGLMQFPFVIYQRFFIFRNFGTGDFVTGTLLISSILSLYLICCLTILTSFFMKKKVKLFMFLVLSILLFLPTTLNETKGTIILFPIAICTLILLSSGRFLSFKKIALIASGAALLVFVFIPVYGYLYPQMDLISFFKGEGEKTRSIQGYLYKEVDKSELGEKEPGRIDILLYPFQVLSKEPFKLIIGLGMGNVNPSGISLFEGEYAQYGKFLPEGLTASSLIWETGLIGLFLHAVLLWLIFKDAVAIRSLNEITGILALGWAGIVIIIWLSFFYKSIFHQKVIIYLFWYISGIIAARRTKFELS